MKKVTPKKKTPVKKFDHMEHWKGMPEFVQPGLKPIKSLIVNLATKEDMHKFSKLMGQPITHKTKFIWYPFVPDEKYIDKRWSDKKPKK
jgi:hypothetical protein